MMMTGSLKQAKYNALPRGLISCTNLQLIRLRPLSVCLLLSLCTFLPLFYNLRLFRSLFCSGCQILSSSLAFPMNGHLTGLLEPQALFSQLSVCLRNG